MSHSWEGSNGTKIIYNPDLSEVIVCNASITTDGAGENVECYLNGQDLLEFIADHIRSERISALEDMSTEQILGLEEKE